MQNEGVKQPTGLTKVILAASTGTLIEWYDFYIFGSLATILSAQFFPDSGVGVGLLKTLATFAAGFLVRPFGAVVFGRMGDLIGRKHTFLLTLLMMGLSTTAIGLIPSYASIGVLAPILLVALRLTQGLALGGQYGGAALYIAETAPASRRGYFTSFLQTTATLGLFVSLIIILVTRAKLTEPVFLDWGWRIPFLLSSVLVIFSYLIRRRMEESPAFAALKAGGGLSKNPLTESFVNPVNRKKVLVALFGLTAGQGVVWYTSQFYVNIFMKTSLHIHEATCDQIVAWALVFGTPFFILFGAMSDRIGRKKLIMAGLALAIVGYIPIYQGMQSIAVLDSVSSGGPHIHLDRTTDPKTGAAKATRVIEISDDAGVKQISRQAVDTKDTSQPLKGEKEKMELMLPTAGFWTLVGLVFLQVFFVTLVYAPIAALLVEMFPVQIRYTSMSVPYHIGNGVFGGLVPLVATWIALLRPNQPLTGLLYPIGIALITLIVGMIFVHEKKGDEGFTEEA